MNALRGLRGLRDLSQAELGKKAKMHQPEISRLERGLRATPKQLKKITKAFGLTEGHE